MRKTFLTGLREAFNNFLNPAPPFDFLIHQEARAIGESWITIVVYAGSNRVVIYGEEGTVPFVFNPGWDSRFDDMDAAINEAVRRYEAQLRVDH